MKAEKFTPPNEQMSRLGKHHWSVPRLFTLAKDLEVMEIPLDHLNISYIFRNLSLRELVGHVIAVNEADLAYPIILDEDGDVMDGRHRIMKAIIEGAETIKAVRFEENPSPCRIDD